MKSPEVEALWIGMLSEGTLCVGALPHSPQPIGSQPTHSLWVGWEPIGCGLSTEPRRLESYGTMGWAALGWGPMGWDPVG